MCLVEVEGLPKLQAGCTLTAQDGMVVKTAASSEKAAEGQNATLEFILVNHPLDCPVCDKGGECPLQDLTFRYGPGNTRMSFSKITLEKPIPVSPLIALDRERCILCYRCTRFSSDVAEDNQLVARNRGAHTEITTFESDPYRAPFSGQRDRALPRRSAHLDAVPLRGAPVGHPERADRLRALLRRLQHQRDGARGQGQADPLPQPPRGRRRLALRQGPLHVSAPASPRIASPSRSSAGELGLEPVSWDAALDRAEALLREAGTRTVTALSGSETRRAGLRARAPPARRARRARRRAARVDLRRARRVPRCRSRRSREAEIVVIVGDDDVADRAPVVDLWLKAARRNGAEIVRYGPTGTEPTGPGGAAAALRALVRSGNELGERLRAAERAILVWSGSGGGGGARLAEAAHALGFEGKPGSGAFHLPATPNGRGVAAAWAAAADEDEANPEPIGLLIVSGDEAAADPGGARARRARRARDRDHDVPRPRRRLGRPRPARRRARSSATARSLNLEGRLQRLRRAVIAPVPDELAWIAKLAARFDVELSPHAVVVFDELSALVFGGVDGSELNGTAPLPARTPYEAPAPAAEAKPRHACRSPPTSTSSASSACSATGRSSPARSSSASASSPSSARRPSSSSRPRTPTGGRSRPATPSSSARTAPRSSCARASTAGLVEGVARVADEHAADLHLLVEVVKP